jgi:CDP-diacylglycerol--glycerol-3-phosphate 3-phosphatidyltransferase
MSARSIVNLPNFLTVLRIALTPVFVVMLSSETWYGKAVAFVVFTAASLTDFYDGRLARADNQVTTLGRFLDPLADKILVTSALVAFAVSDLVNRWLVLPIVVRDVWITGMRVYGLSRGRQLVTSRLAKWKTAVQLGVVVFLLFVLGLQDVLGRSGGDLAQLLDRHQMGVLANGLMGVVLLLTLGSGLQYLYRARYSGRDT